MEPNPTTPTGQIQRPQRREWTQELEAPPFTRIFDSSPEGDLAPKVVEAIKTVFDPEIPHVDVYELGLIYEVSVYPDCTVNIRMTLTAPSCPAAGILPGQVESAARDVEGIEDAAVELTFDPPFGPEMMSDAAKLDLGFM